ncbi:hypothetical protein EYF80_060188 [Liparis tanakae]|uniref:Uncharacterized protein n=1 Tax=Liparis tanakae TaxID=230148 RepID=A0A4Z2ELD8_9TELE|nr:hypothetical protein EYF80_060188 [Liparis tanakae]
MSWLDSGRPGGLLLCEPAASDNLSSSLGDDSLPAVRPRGRPAPETQGGGNTAGGAGIKVEYRRHSESNSVCRWRPRGGGGGGGGGRLLHADLRSLVGDGRRQLGLETVEEGQRLSGRGEPPSFKELCHGLVGRLLLRWRDNGDVTDEYR